MTTTKARARRRPQGNLPGWREAMKDGLTAAQREVLLLIVRRIVENGRPPTFRWLMEQTGILSPNGMRWHLDALTRKGVIERDFTRPCGVRLVGCTLRLDCDDSPAGLRLRRLLGCDTYEQGGGI